MTKSLIENAICTACNCVCDDIGLTVEDNRIVQAQNACHLGEMWYGRSPIDPPQKLAWLDGRPTSLDEAITSAAQLLTQAHRPLVYGLVNTTCEAQQQAVALADDLGAAIDIASPVGSSLSGLAFQELGKSTATLGEVRNRADLVVYWGADPLETHPRHLSRFATSANGNPNRTLVVIDTQRTRTADAADLFIQIKPGSDFEMLGVLRALINDKPCNPDVAADTGVSLDVIKDLAARMKGCQYGAVFVGAGFVSPTASHYNTKSLIALADDLNQHARFVVLPVYGRGNAAGASQVLTWQTGYPFAVDFSRGFPRFGPGEFDGAAMLARRECDAVLVVAGSSLPLDVSAYLQQLPVIVIGAASDKLAASTKVAIPTATYGIHAGGTVYRMDDVSLALRPALQSIHPTDEAILLAVRKQVQQIQGAG